MEHCQDKMMEVGQVVSKNTGTDLLSFEIKHPHMNGRVNPLKLLPWFGLI